MYMITWISIVAVLILIEICTVNLVTIWFALGAFVAFLCAVFHAPLYVQLIVFIVVSVLSLILTYPVVKKMRVKNKNSTNFNRIIGMVGIVTEPIDDIMGKGYVLVDGKQWMARTGCQDKIDKGVKVNVLRIEGAKIYVKEAK